MEDSAIITISEEMIEAPEEETAKEEATSIQEILTELTTTELLTSTEMTTTTTEKCLTYVNLEKIDIEHLNQFTYLGSAFIIASLFLFACKFFYRIFNMFF